MTIHGLAPAAMKEPPFPIRMSGMMHELSDVTPERVT